MQFASILASFNHAAGNMTLTSAGQRVCGDGAGLQRALCGAALPVVL